MRMPKVEAALIWAYAHGYAPGTSAEPDQLGPAQQYAEYAMLDLTMDQVQLGFAERERKLPPPIPASVADIPASWTPTRSPARRWGGVEWRVYRRGINNYVFVAEVPGETIWLNSNHGGSTFSSGIRDDENPPGWLIAGSRFRTEEAAALAALKLAGVKP